MLLATSAHDSADPVDVAAGDGVAFTYVLFAWPAEGNRVLASYEVTNTAAPGGPAFDGRLVAGLRIAPRFRSTDPAMHRSGATYADVRIPGGNGYYSSGVHKHTGPGRAGCFNAGSADPSSFASGARGAVARFDINGLGPGQTRTYDLVLVPLADEPSGLGFWVTYYSDSKNTWACPAAHLYKRCDLDGACDADETADSCAEDCGCAPPAGEDGDPLGTGVDNGFCHRDGDAVCGEGEHPGVAGADGFAVDCGCGPGTFYMLKPGSGASCGDGEEWRVFYGSTASVAAGEEGLRRQPGEIWSQPDYVEGQSGAGYWDNGLNSARYRMPYLYPCSAGETESEHCFRIFRRWLWVDDGAENALLWVNVSNMEGLRINGCRRRILGIE